MDKLPDDPSHPIYYHVFSDSLPEEIAYRIIDKKKDIITHSKESVL